MSQKDSLARQLSSFEGVYCSGLFVPDPAMTTALALVFERVHLLANEDFVIEFAKQSGIRIPEAEDPTKHTTWRILEDSTVVSEDAYPSLNSEQRERAFYYERIAGSFFEKYALLCKDIFRSTYINPNKSVTLQVLDKNGNTTFRAKGGPGQIRLIAQGGFVVDFAEHIAAGRVPVLARMLPQREPSINTVYSTTKNPILSPSQIAAALALQAVAMVLPATREADSETILEARERLKDHLPPFWSSMLKLSVELKERLKSNATIEECQHECDYAVTTILRPALIDLVDKLEKERKQWFYRILSPLASGLSVLVGKPPVTTAELISASLRLGANVAIDVSDQIRKVEAMKSEAGLAYLLELHKRIR